MKFHFSLAQLAAYSFIFSLLFLVSCSKERSGTTNAEEEEVSKVTGESDAEAESTYNGIFDDVMGVSNDVGIAGSGVFYGRPDSLQPVTRCFTVTVTHPTANFFPVNIVIDFGTTGCHGPDGRVRRGRINVHYSNKLIYPGAVATTTFDGFYVNATHIEGTHKITNISTSQPPANLAPKYKIEVINGKLTKPNGDYTEWNSTRTIAQIEGMITPDFAKDDVYRIEGGGNGLVRRGNLLVRWESTITEPLFRRNTCRWIVKGRVRTIRANLPNPANSPWVGVLDFGGGPCDNLATITINGISRQITLP